jgi:hypothetical protein
MDRGQKRTLCQWNKHDGVCCYGNHWALKSVCSLHVLHVTHKLFDISYVTCDSRDCAGMWHCVDT